MELTDFEDNPDRLAKFGFARRDQATTDVVRLVWFERSVGVGERSMRMTVQVQFEASLTDEPRPGPQCSYSFDGVFLHVTLSDGVDWISDRDEPDDDARVALRLTTLQEVQQLIRLLQPSEW